MLRNNAAFSAANLNKIDLAEEHLRRASPSDGDEERTTVTATRGLIAFRQGNPTQGRALYGEAVSDFRRAGNADMSALASSLWAMEELRIHSPAAIDTRDVALEDSVRAKLPEVDLLIDRMNEAFTAPGNWIRPPSS